MKIFYSLALGLCSILILQAQAPNFTADLLQNEAFEPSSVKVLRVEPMGDSVMVALEVNTRGAIQKRMGSLMSGGKDAETLTATYIYVLDQMGKELRKEVQWLKASSAPEKFNYLSMPLTNSDAHLNAKVLATEADVLSAGDYRRFQIKKVMKMTDEEIAEEVENTLSEFVKEVQTAFTPLQELFKKEEYSGDQLPNTIYKTEPLVSVFSGKLNKVRSTSYNKRPNGESGMLTGRYKTGDSETIKVEMASFFDDENKRFTGVNHIVNDPLTGNAIIYAGVKIKKDKSPKDNKFFEHIILRLDKKGNVLSKKTLQNDMGWEVGSSKLIGEESFAVVADPVFDQIFIAQNPPKKDWVKHEDQQRFVIVDKEGEVVFTEVVESVPQLSKSLQRVTQVGDLILVNTYAAAQPHAFAGIYTLDLTKGVLDQALLQTGSDRAQDAAFIPLSGTKDIQNVMYYQTEDGTHYFLDQLYTEARKATTQQPAVPAQYYNYLFYKVSAEGIISNVALMERFGDSFAEPMDVSFLSETEDAFVVKLTDQTAGADFVKMCSLNKADMTSECYSLPNPLLGSDAIFMGEESMYFLVQDAQGGIQLLGY